LPVAAEIDRRLAAHGKTYDGVGLLAVADAAEVFAPRCLAGVTDEIRPSDVAMMSELAAAQARKVGLGAIGAGAVDTVTHLVIDPLHGEAGVQLVPSGALIRMNSGAAGDPLSDRLQSAV